MKTKISCVVVAIFLISNMNAQHQFSFSTNAGVGKMNSSVGYEQSSTSLTSINSRCRSTFGFDANYAYRFRDFSVETGIGYFMLNGKKNELFDIEYSGTPYKDHMNAETVRKAHYLRVPLFVNYHLKKLSFGIGGSVSYLLNNQYTFSLYQNDILEQTHSGGNNLGKFDAGLNAQVSYEFMKNLAVEIKTYIGLVDISNGTERGVLHDQYQLESLNGQLKNRQLTLGLKYFLRKDRKSE